MRLRVCIVLAALTGAAGALALAFDMYHRLELVDRAANSNVSGVVVFGMVHVLGSASMGVLFLAIGLLALSERQKAIPLATDSSINRIATPDIPAANSEAPREMIPSAPESPAAGVPEYTTHVIESTSFSDSPLAQRAPPRNPFRPLNGAPNLPPRLLTPLADAASPEQDNIPVATPIDAVQKTAEAALGDADDGDPATENAG